MSTSLSKSEVSMTPPVSPNINDQEIVSEDDSIDYMDFFLQTKDKLIENKETKVIEPLHNIYCDQTVPAQKVELLFNCHGEGSPPGKLVHSSFLQYKILHNALAMQNPFSRQEGLVIETPRFNQLLDVARIKHLFFKVRQNFQRIGKLCKPFASGNCLMSRDPVSVDAFQLRKETIEIFKSICFFTNKCSMQDKETFHAISNESIKLLKFLGPFHSLPTFVTSAHSPLGNTCTSPVYHQFHLHLDVRWWILIILHLMNLVHTIPSIIDIGYSNDDTGHKTPIDVCIDFLIWDLMTLTMRQVSKASLRELGNMEAGFPCSCSHELALTVLHIIEHRSKGDTKENFYSRFDPKLLVTLLPLVEQTNFRSHHNANLISQPCFQKERGELSHRWWTFVNFAKLFLYDECGETVALKSSAVKHNLKLLVTLTKMIEKTNQSSETELRFYCNCCFNLLRIWPKEIKHVEWIKVLWEHFFRNLDSTFASKKSNLDEFTSSHHSISNILMKVQSIISEDRDLLDENSFILFLRIIATVMRQTSSECRVIQGRIFSKLHGKLLNNLEERGIENTVLLVLVLARSSKADTDKMVVQLFQLLSTDHHNKMNFPKHRMILLGLLSGAQLLISNNSNLEVVDSQIKKSVSFLVDCFLKAQGNIDRSKYGELLTFYFESVGEIMKSSENLELSQHIFFCPSLCSVVNKGTFNELKSSFNCIHTTLNCVSHNSKNLMNLASTNGVSVLKLLWATFGEGLKRHCISHQCEIIVGSIMSSFVLCFARFSRVTVVDSKELHDCAAIILKFIFDSSSVSPKIMNSFISSLLSEDDSLQLLPTLCEKYEFKLVSSLLSSLISEGTSYNVMETSGLVLNLPSIANLVPEVPASPFAAFEMILQILMNKYKLCQSFQDRLPILEMIKSFYDCLKSAVPNVLKRKPPVEHVAEIFSLVGCLFNYGYPVLYSKTNQDYVLNSLLKSVILPAGMYNRGDSLLYPKEMEKLLPTVILALSNLHLDTDMNALRSIKDCFDVYVHRFQVDRHPILKVFMEFSPNRLKLRKLFLSAVSFNCSLVHFQIVLSLLLNLLKQDSEFWLESYVARLFKGLLEKLMNLKDPRTRSCIQEFLSSIFIEVDTKQKQIRPNVCEILRQFSAEHIPWYHGQVFKVLEQLAKINHSLIVDILPGVATIILMTEGKRGGMDASIRRGYNAFLVASSLQENYLL